VTEGKKIEFSEHPEYKELSSYWLKYRVLYEGTRSALIGPEYLWPHEIESSTAPYKNDAMSGIVTVGDHLRLIRARRSRYMPLFESIVSTWVSLLFHKPLKYDKDAEKLLEEDGGKDDIDGLGTSFEDFVKHKIAPVFFRDGNPILVVDASGGTFASKLEEKAAGFRPYFELKDNLAVKDWQFFDEGEKRGKYQWLRDEYSLIEPRTSPLEKPRNAEYCKVYTVANGVYEQELYKKDDNGDWKSLGPLPISGWDELPAATIRTNESWCEGVAELQLVLFNLMSAWYNQLNMQAHQRGILAGDMGEKHQISISEYTWAIVPAGTVPHIFEPSSTEPLTDAIDRTIDQIYKVAYNRNRGLSSDSKEAPSESTLREMNDELVTLLLSAMTQIESLINEGLRFYAKFKGIEDFKGKVSFSHDLTSEDVTKRMELYSIYRDEIRKVESWRKAELKKASLQMGYSDEEQKEIEDDIEALKPEPELLPGMANPIPILGNGRQKQQITNDANAPKAPGKAKDDSLGSEGRGAGNKA
jgi:hypothetical protein